MFKRHLNLPGNIERLAVILATYLRFRMLHKPLQTPSVHGRAPYCSLLVESAVVSHDTPKTSQGGSGRAAHGDG